MGGSAIEQAFVKFSFPCDCGTDLEVHCKPFIGGRGNFSHIVKCPKCDAEHELPTKALRLFYRDGNLWYKLYRKSKVPA